jgi:hypothetical protein
MMSWKLVPDWPAREQIEAAYDQFGTEGPDWELVYRAMLSASPPPPDILGALESALAALTDDCIGTRNQDDPDWYEKVRVAVEKINAVLPQLKGEKA